MLPPLPLRAARRRRRTPSWADMAGFRELRRQARRDLHEELEVPSFYLRTLTSDPSTATLAHVRLWAAFGGKIGDVRGSRIYPAEYQNEVDKIRFDMCEITRLENGGIVSITAGEAYRIDNILAPDDEFQTAEVTRLAACDAAGLPVPDPWA
jgi:hypothetical protein